MYTTRELDCCRLHIAIASNSPSFIGIFAFLHPLLLSFPLYSPTLHIQPRPHAHREPNQVILSFCFLCFYFSFFPCLSRSPCPPRPCTSTISWMCMHTTYHTPPFVSGWPKKPRGRAFFSLAVLGGIYIKTIDNNISDKVEELREFTPSFFFSFSHCYSV